MILEDLLDTINSRSMEFLYFPAENMALNNIQKTYRHAFWSFATKLLEITAKFWLVDAELTPL